MRQPEAFLVPQNAPKSLAAGAYESRRGEGRGSRRKQGKGGQGRGGQGREGKVCLVLKLPLATPLLRPTVLGEDRSSSDQKMGFWSWSCKVVFVLVLYTAVLVL